MEVSKEIDGTKGERSTPTPWNLAGQRGCRLGFGVVICFSEFVIDLLQAPILTLYVSHSGLHDRPLSPKFRAIQGESHDAVVERGRCVGSLGSDHLKFAEVPYDDFARAVFTFREGFLEQKVVKRVVFHVDREAPHTRIFARPLRHGPRYEDRANFQPEVIVEIPGPVLLDRESGTRSSGPRIRFGDDGRGHADGPDGPSGFCVTRPFVWERKGPQSLRLSDSLADFSLLSVSCSDRR